MNETPDATKLIERVSALVDAAKSAGADAADAVAVRGRSTSVSVRLGKVALSVRASDVSQPADPTGSDTLKAVPPTARRVMRTISQLSAATPADPSPLKAAATTWGQDVSPALNQRITSSSAATTVRVFQGAAAEKEFKFE